MNKKLRGFTLTETMLAIGIIGVISALTVPTLYNNYQRNIQLTSINKFYNDLTQAVQLFMLDISIPNIYKSQLNVTYKPATNEESVGAFMKNYMRVKSDCKDSVTPCFASSYQNLYGEKSAITCDGYTVTLDSGAAVCMIPSTGVDPNPDNVIPVTVVVDTNGAKLPNIGGRDIFVMNIYEDGTIDEGATPQSKLGSAAGTPEQMREAQYQRKCLRSGYFKGEGCFAKILNDSWKMNY